MPPKFYFQEDVSCDSVSMTNKLGKPDNDFDPWMAFVPVFTMSSMTHFANPRPSKGDQLAFTPFGQHQTYPARVSFVMGSQVYMVATVPFAICDSVLKHGGTILPPSLLTPKLPIVRPSPTSSSFGKRFRHLVARVFQSFLSLFKSKSFLIAQDDQ